MLTFQAALLEVDAARAPQLRRRTVLGMVGMLAQGVARFATAVVIGRLGGPSLLGLTQSALATGQLVSLFGPASAGSAASRFVASERGRGDAHGARAVAWFLFIFGLTTGFFLGVATLPFVVLTYGSDRSEAVVAGVSTFGISGYLVARGLHLGAGQVERSAVLDVCCAVTGVVGAGLLLISGARTVWVVLPVALAFLLYTALSVPRARLTMPRSGLRILLSFIVLGAFGTLASAGLLQGSILVARHTGGVHAAGQYAAALTLATPISMLAGALSQALFPMLAEARARSDLEGARQQTIVATERLASLLVGAAGVLIIIADQLVQLVWGSEFADSSDAIRLLLVAVAANGLSVPSVNLLTSGSNRGMAISALSSVAGAATAIAAWSVLIPIVGADGVAGGYMIGVLVIAGVPVVVVGRRHRLAWSGLWTKTAVCSIAVGMAFSASTRVGSPGITYGLAVLFLIVWVTVWRTSLSWLLTIPQSRR